MTDDLSSTHEAQSEYSLHEDDDEDDDNAEEIVMEDMSKTKAGNDGNEEFKQVKLPNSGLPEKRNNKDSSKSKKSKNLPRTKLLLKSKISGRT